MPTKLYSGISPERIPCKFSGSPVGIPPWRPSHEPAWPVTCFYRAVTAVAFVMA
ncbi:hypothetical protein B4098_0585 [Heyndrickxia coagulans]|uniref:Uncharacterized protein n=1 Tax=Heyndrickxia coagulans TaxID=1398 RepID=A0A150K6E8_HEYCO|nr:hypothetical protein B4098_0585 [Heyndrickxia coagulans]